MSTIVFSHGFGVKADARGMFTQIAATFPQHQFVLFDYGITFENGDTELTPLATQARILQQKLNEQTGDVIIIAHSQGCVIASMVDVSNVAKVILLAPPMEMSAQRIIDMLMKRPGSEINLDGISKLPRRDGTTTHISKEYLDSVGNVHPRELYEKLTERTDTTIVRCLNDEVLGLTDVDTVPRAKHIDISADHDFTEASRNDLLSLLAQEL